MKRLRVAALLAVAACRGSSPPPPQRLNILLINIDTLRADRLTPETMPNVTALAAKGTRFTRSRGNGRPFFAWIHLYDPHAPHEPPPEYMGRARGRRHDAEVLFADAQVGWWSSG